MSRALSDRFGEHVARKAFFEDGDRLLVALSGGLDSLVLLHLLRFSGGVPSVELFAAHFDHRLRPGSPGDAAWVRGLGRAWEVPVRLAAAESPPGSEARARELRYAFLEEVRLDVGARWILTAHHADDQAETVLHRAVRGTGLRGLQGIPERREPGIVRPLLPFWKEELGRYARAARLSPRIDPSNLEPRFSRNVLRNEILPRLEEAVAPGARRALVRLASLARSEERALGALVRHVADSLVVEREGDRVVVAREALLAHPPGARARLLRELFRGLGIRLDRAGTRAALRFTRAGASGRGIQLSRGGALRREFDRLVFEGAPVDGGRGEGETRSLRIPGAASGAGSFQVGGRGMRAEWTVVASPGGFPAVAGASEGDPPEAFSSSLVRFPLLLRSWCPGDRILLSYGTKKLSKLFAEARIPASERSRVPVLVDAAGRVLWVPGVARSARALPEEGDTRFFIGITDADD